MNYQSFLDYYVLQVTLYKKKIKFNWISFFHEYNQVLLWQDPSKTTLLIVNGLQEYQDKCSSPINEEVKIDFYCQKVIFFHKSKGACACSRIFA